MIDLLDGLLTPTQIAERIIASSGVHISARSIWEKARRLGIAKKLARAMLISIDDIPLLLQEEKKADRPMLVRSGNDALKALHRARKARARKRI